MHTTFYQSWTVELINWYWRSINRGDKLFGSRRLRSHDFSYLRFYNYSPGGESRCAAPSQKWNKTCAHIRDHVYSSKQRYVHVLHRIIAVIITLIIWTLAWNCTLLSSLTQNLNGEEWNVQQLEMQILYWAFCCSGHVHLITVFTLHQPPPRAPPFCNKCKWEVHTGRVVHGGRRGQRTHQSANHGSALVALRTLLTFWPWPWPKGQRSPSRVSKDHCRSLARDASPWQHLDPYRRRDGGVLHLRL